MEKIKSTHPPNRMAIRAAVSIKKGSGTILIRRSVRASRIQRSLSKKIWWKIIKYFVKSVDITAAKVQAGASAYGDWQNLSDRSL